MSAYSESLFDTSFANSSFADISSSEAELRPVYMGELPEFYVVEEGDTLWGISYFFNIEMEVLAELNHLSESDIHRLGVGQKIRLQGEPAQANLSMQIRLVDAVGMPIKRPRVKVFADAEWSDYVGDIEGYLPPLIIEKPQYGLHIDFYNIAQKWETVHQSEALPWGVFDLTLFSGDVLVEVPLLPLAGVQQNTAAAVKAHIQNHQQQAAAQAKQETPVLKSKHAEAPASKPQTPVRVDTRVEQGKPSVDIAFKNVEGGLALYGPYNENYRPLILEAAKKHKLAPWQVAALIQVECHKEMKPVSSTLKNGEKKTSLMEQWHNLCRDLKSDAAQGLCQCRGAAWMDIAVNPNSALHAKLLQMYQIKGLQLGFRKKKDAPGSGEITQDKQKSTDGSKYLFSENGKEIPREEFLALRGDEALSIDGGCIYGLNLL
ncbi:MAG: LysM peptidoglycan-binding domain-containing protein, partial [Burkholderiales bacterium]|nr:LysM peptidoglycan-binding domain-containing protein [Burkholderiales bacterium]